MPKARKKKTPITTSENPASSSNPQSSRTLIRRFHVLLKQQQQLKHAGTNPANAKALADVEHEIEELGGLPAYQRMSSIGQGNDRGGGSEKVLITWLQEMRLFKREGAGRLRLLEVGALKPDNYASCATWIDVTPMDLRSRHPAILEQDFLLVDVSEHQGKWDIVSLSLVVNFAPEPKDRGRMLLLAHTILAPDGLLFLALPLPCVENSRYFTFELLGALMRNIGFCEVRRKWKKGGKMAYWLYRKGEKSDIPADDLRKKVICRQGNRNNFVILLP
ncbi:nucleolus protein [Leucogyrophana mollusca]|uniref:Nucleolus protein n=1 Tax=Leucogyrophana mollusca TaxID=85980 RepID=A0ACB8BQ41_9AGAM|nr:nucleolus protein [Leucogyrophana mollusca]